MLRDAEIDLRRSYARMLEVVTELEVQKAGPVTGFGTTARLVAGVLNLSTSAAKARVAQAQLRTPHQSLTGEVLPPVTHPGVVAQAEHTLATAARRFDPSALTRIGERLLVHLGPGWHRTHRRA